MHYALFEHALLHLFYPAAPLIDLQQIPVYLYPFCSEQAGDVTRDGIKVVGRQCQDGRTGTRETDA